MTCQTDFWAQSCFLIVPCLWYLLFLPPSSFLCFCSLVTYLPYPQCHPIPHLLVIFTFVRGVSIQKFFVSYIESFPQEHCFTLEILSSMPSNVSFPLLQERNRTGKITRRETCPREHSCRVNLAFVLWQQQNSPNHSRITSPLFFHSQCVYRETTQKERKTSLLLPSLKASVSLQRNTFKIFPSNLKSNVKQATLPSTDDHQNGSGTLVLTLGKYLCSSVRNAVCGDCSPVWRLGWGYVALRILSPSYILRRKGLEDSIKGYLNAFLVFKG